MIDSIGIRNIRSLKDLRIGDNDVVELKPITVLLGQNSSGKSSFLRTFPLLKQSVTSRTRGALALFGDEVDFGDFATTISSDSLDDKDSAYIEFRFKGSCFLGLRNPYRLHTRNGSQKKFDIEYRIKSTDLMEILYVSDFLMKVGEVVYSFTVDSDHILTSLKVNNIEYIYELGSLEISDSGITPCFPFFLDANEALYKQFYKFLGIDNDESFFFRWEYLDAIDNVTMLKDILASREMTKEYFRDENLCNFLMSKRHDEEFVINFYNRLHLFRFEHVYRKIVNDLIQNFSSVSYSKPLRANADRYYRSRYLSSNEVNSDGSNLVDFYNCLEKEKKKDLNRWMDENFGFFYTIESSQGHKSIIIYEEDKTKNNISDKNKVKHNITDMGFGFSQILPIATQLWALKNKNNNYPYTHINYIYAIEQPELHLHPAMQCKLINALSKIPKLAAINGIKVTFIIETHSETMVNQLGRLIDRKDLSCEDVSVLIFSKNSSSFTKIQQSKFNDKGELTQWPIGFFGEDV